MYTAGAGAPTNSPTSTASTVSDDETRRACLAFHKFFPRRSVRRTFYATQILAGALFIGALFWAWRTHPGETLDAVHAAAFTAFSTMIAWRLIAAASLTPKLSRIAHQTQWPIYTVLCPVHREASVVADLVAAIERLDYPLDSLDVKLLVEADDGDTLAAALSLAKTPSIEVLVVPPMAPRTKPKALNVGLARARGEYLVVYDAEDRPHPLQLRAAIAAFQDGDERLACVQAPLAIDNASVSWISRQFATEYAIQFREILPLLARLNLPLPLGGSSNHFRTEVLRTIGGWDPFNVTEDADLGYRLARDRWRTGVIAPPTYEEAPVTFGAWLNQRTRWIKSHMQTWLVLMRDPFRVAAEMGGPAYLSMHLVLGGGLLAALVHGPIAATVIVAALSPDRLLGPADFVLALAGYCTAAFMSLTACALTGSWIHARTALTMPLYWPLATIAALRAALELVLAPHHWSKTAHGVSARPLVMPSAIGGDCGSRLSRRQHA